MHKIKTVYVLDTLFLRSTNEGVLLYRVCTLLEHCRMGYPWAVIGSGLQFAPQCSSLRSKMRQSGLVGESNSDAPRFNWCDHMKLPPAQ